MRGDIKRGGGMTTPGGGDGDVLENYDITKKSAKTSEGEKSNKTGARSRVKTVLGAPYQ